LGGLKARSSPRYLRKSAAASRKKEKGKEKKRRQQLKGIEERITVTRNSESPHTLQKKQKPSRKGDFSVRRAPEATCTGNVVELRQDLGTEEKGAKGKEVTIARRGRKKI